MFRAIILLIFRSTRLCVTACGTMHRRCCRPATGRQHRWCFILYQKKIPYLCDSWYMSLSIDDCLVCRAEWIPPCIPDSHLYRVTNTRFCIGTVFFPDDGHTVARNMYRKAINLLRKFVHQVGSICKRLYKDAGQQNIKLPTYFVENGTCLFNVFSKESFTTTHGG
jgi:hypothetical protein